MNKLIPWAKPCLFGNEAARIQEALESTWISGGPFVDQFEKELGAWIKAPYVSATSNGTTAIHLAYLALGIGIGDEVIIPGFGYLAAANIALLCGAKPVFAEVDPATWCLTAEAVARCITPKTKAVVAIHTYGNMCDLDALADLLAPRKIALIEDAAEALGSTYKGRAAGASGAIGTYSFHATKTITTGEGGLIATHDPELHRKIQLYRSHGMSRDVRFYWHEVPGHNFRLTNFQAAMGCAQFEHFPEIKDARLVLDSQYRQLLLQEAGLEMQHFEASVVPVLWAVAIRLDPDFFSQGRDEVLLQMRQSGIECRPGFYAASQQPLYQSGALPICEDLASKVISLPCYVGLKAVEVAYICETLISLRGTFS